MLKLKIKAFTLVELIVVVTILAILSTIGFVSYSSYLVGVRDTNRVSNLKSLSDGLEMYRTKNTLPIPETNIEVKTNGTRIAWQGYAGSNVLETIDFSNGGKDPKDDTYFSYYLTNDKKYFQLLAFLEESEKLQVSLGNKTNAAIDYESRYPTVYGKKLGILTRTDNTPIQEDSTITGSGYLDITTSTTTTYKAHFQDSDVLEATGATLLTIAPDANCNRIKELKGRSQDGLYSINPYGTGTFIAYCDMTVDGGGWTLVARSVSGATGAFGWNTTTGSPSINSAPYSMGNKADDIIFDQIMVASYTNSKVIDGAVILDVDGTLIKGTTLTTQAASNVEQVIGTGTTSVFDYWGAVNESDQYFFDSTPTLNAEGLLVNGFDTGTSNLFDGKQGMVFIK